MPATASTSRSRTAAAAAYLLGFVTGIALLRRHRDDSYVRFHAWQSTLFSAALVASVVALQFVPIVGSGLAIVLAVVGAGTWIALLVQAYRGRWFLLPLIGDVALERARPGG